jgi:hypothetical protein
VNNPADIQDVIAGFERPLTTGERSAVPAWLNLAWPRFRRAVPGLALRLELPAENPAHIDLNEVKAVLAEMVIRRLRNPDALRQWNDDNYGQTVDSELSAGKIYVTDEEREQFALPDIGGDQAMYTIQLSTT